MILVLGGTGPVGREVVASLSSAGQKVRVLTRNPSKRKLPAGVEAAEGDLERPETLAGAFEGAEKVFSVTSGPGITFLDGHVAKAANQAGVRHIVKLSVLGAGEPKVSGVAEWHGVGEQAIKDSGIAWTFVRPGMFMSNALGWALSVKSQGQILLNFGDGKFAPIHPRDIAAVVVKALTEAGHEGKAYPLTGPEALSVLDIARVLSFTLGRPIEYVPITDEVVREAMADAGIPPPVIDALVAFGTFVRSGQAATVLPNVEQVTGRKALTFAQWAKENAAAFS
jgi:uncharacterized protein YbjT (DUF2867 family)